MKVERPRVEFFRLVTLHSMVCHIDTDTLYIYIYICLWFVMPSAVLIVFSWPRNPLRRATTRDLSASSTDNILCVVKFRIIRYLCASHSFGILPRYARLLLCYTDVNFTVKVNDVYKALNREGGAVGFIKRVTSSMLH